MVALAGTEWLNLNEMKAVHMDEKEKTMTIFLILATVFAVLFNTVCLRTGMLLKRSVTRTVVPTGCEAR